MNASLPSEPNSVIPCNALAFYGDSWADALGKAAYYLNSIPETNKHVSEPLIRLVHYSPYDKPFTATLVIPTESKEPIKEGYEPA
jgi:hypothetical protein